MCGALVYRLPSDAYIANDRKLLASLSNLDQELDLCTSQLARNTPIGSCLVFGKINL